MALTEGRRKRLYDKFEEVLGVDNAEVMMELLPPVGWADVATNRELDHLRVTLESRIEATEQRVLAEMYRELAAVRGEVADVRGEIAAVRGEVADVRGEIGGLREDMASMMRSLMIWGTGLCTSLAGLAFTAGHLL